MLVLQNYPGLATGRSGRFTSGWWDGDGCGGASSSPLAFQRLSEAGVLVSDPRLNHEVAARRGLVRRWPAAQRPGTAVAPGEAGPSEGCGLRRPWSPGAQKLRRQPALAGERPARVRRPFHRESQRPVLSRRTIRPQLLGDTSGDPSSPRHVPVPDTRSGSGYVARKWWRGSITQDAFRDSGGADPRGVGWMTTRAPIATARR